jgi:hypothetical protein
MRGSGMQTPSLCDERTVTAGGILVHGVGPNDACRGGGNLQSLTRAQDEHFEDLWMWTNRMCREVFLFD